MPFSIPLSHAIYPLAFSMQPWQQLQKKTTKKSSEAAWSQVKQQLEVSAEGPLNKSFIRTDISHMLFFIFVLLRAPFNSAQDRH